MGETADLAQPVARATTRHPHESARNALKNRILSGAVMIFLAVLFTAIGGWVFAAIVAFCSMLMVYEWNTICSKRGNIAAIGFQCALIWVVVIATKLGRPDIALLAIGLALPAGYILARPFQGHPFWTPLGAVYAALPAMAIVWIRHYDDTGLSITVWLFLVIWATDIGGYLFGRTIGGPKLVPSISPNKTWAGLVGGMALAVISSVVLSFSFPYGAHYVTLAVIAALSAVWAQVGDIAESALKRHFGVKDSGTLIPGHGGLLDRLDGLVFLAPVIAACVWVTDGRLF